jgi:predicted GIY-YIG superfamily endonuclease
MIGVVYLLTSIETGMGYIGSTINLTQRLRNHRRKKYNSCRSKMLGRFTCLILEEFIDDDITDEDEFKFKLELVERKWQDLYWGYLVNKKRSQITREEEIEKKKNVVQNIMQNILKNVKNKVQNIMQNILKN